MTATSTPEIEQTIQQQIQANRILLYMKGSPEQPQCGFSAQATQALMACGKRFAYVDILSNPDIRSTLPKVSNWPTFPQLFVNGELVGGCDIITEMYRNCELQPLLDEADQANKASQADQTDQTGQTGQTGQADQIGQADQTDQTDKAETGPEQGAG